MSCTNCTPAPEACVTVYPVANPCDCDSPAGIEEIGPTGTTGPKGFTPQYSVGTVGSGDSSIEVVSTGYATRAVNWVLPAIPEGVPYTWTEVNTFAQKSIFEQGLETTGGESTFGGNSFNVTPDASFSGDVDVDGDETIAGDLTESGDVSIEGNISVEGDAIFDDVVFTGPVNLTTATMELDDVSGYASGLFVLDSCLAAKTLRNHGSGTYTKLEAAGLTNVLPVDTGPICDPIVITVPVSACLPQVTPVCDIRIRVGYLFGSSGSDVLESFQANLWQGGIGVTLLDFYTQGDGLINGQGGCFELRAQATLVVGPNTFDVEVTNNDTVEGFAASDVTFWLEN